MGCIVITIPKADVAKRLREIIKRSDIWEEVIICSKGSETIRTVKKYGASMVICTQKFSDMGYEELCGYLPPSVRIILLTKDNALIPFSGNVVKLTMPFRGEELINLLHKMHNVEPVQKKRGKRRSPEEQKIIDQAKELLIRQKNMSEPDAFRYLQKTSMDMGRSMLDTARMLLLMENQ